MADRSKRGPFQSISDVGHVARDARNILYESHLSYAIRSPSTLFIGVFIEYRVFNSSVFYQKIEPGSAASEKGERTLLGQLSAPLQDSFP